MRLLLSGLRLLALLASSSSPAESAAAASDRVFDVTHFGAKGDGQTSDTTAVHAALAAAAKASCGGTVIFPAHKLFLTGPFNISSHTELVIETNTSVLADPDAEWPLVDPRVTWPQFGVASDCFPLSDPKCYSMMHQPFVFSWNTVNVTVRGEGTIDGQGTKWWACAGSCPHAPYCNASAKYPGPRGCPRCPTFAKPCNGIGRPHLIMMANVTNVDFIGVRIQHSPDWTLHFSDCTGVHVDGVWVYNGHNPNGDGIDIDSSQQVLVENSYINVEDDSLCIKSGLDATGRAYGRPTRDVLFRNNTLGRGGGLTIGSEGSGGVYNVTFQNLTLNGTSCAVHIKSRPSRGGVYDGIFFKDIVAHNVYKLFDVNMGGTCRSNASGFCSHSTRPQLNNVVVENVRFTADAHVTNHTPPLKNVFGDIVGTVSGDPNGIENFTLRNVEIEFESTWGACSNVVNGRCEGTTNRCPACFAKN